MSTWTLRGSGRRATNTWSYLNAVTEGWTAAWPDVDGFHLDSMPTTPPVTTHLWAWTTGQWLRVRIDGRSWWAALLLDGERNTAEFWQEPETIEVPEITPLRHWLPEEGQVKQYRGSDDMLGEHSMVQFTPVRRTTAPFLGHCSTLP